MVKPAIAKPKDLRQFCIVPIRATRDPRITPTVLRTLTALCAYTDRMGRTFVSQDRLGKDLGLTGAAVGRHIRILKDLGYVANAKPLHRSQRSKSRRVIYTPRMTEEDIRSALSSAEVMDLAEAEAQIIAAAKSKGKANANAEQGRQDLKARFVMSCEQYFAEARAAGWWISDFQARRASLALAEQAAGCLRLDMLAAEAPSSDLGYLDDPDADLAL